jgi:glycerol-3-phosphate dehydrogenase
MPDIPRALTPSAFDVAIIGGGINGCGIARDAAGRGWSVYLCEQGDLGGATSSASTKLIHGGLRYLEYGEFGLVRSALREREVLWGIAPHIIRPMRFVLPYQKGLRPAWLLRLGLFLYDHLGGRRRLPPTRTLDLATDPAGRPLQPGFTRAFEYSDCWVEDSRLVVLNARDAADRGAVIAPRTACLGAERIDGAWHVTVEDTEGRRTIRARTLINAAGPWADRVLGMVLPGGARARTRLVKGSHLVVRRLFDHDRSYIFQNTDGRIVFAIPYERDFTLIGTTDDDYRGDPADVGVSAADIAYLCDAASACFRNPVTPADVVWSYAGVRPLYDDGAREAQAATRDYVLEVDASGGAALLTIFGGKITTYRKLAEAALARLQPYLPPATGKPPGWTATAPLPGGDFEEFEAEVMQAERRYPFLPRGTARRLVRAYGTRIAAIIGAARDMGAMGRCVAADLTEAEIAYLVRAEWAFTAADIAWRRSKLGLRLSAAEIADLEAIVLACRATSCQPALATGERA